MQFVGFDWDRGNREKCRKHGLGLEEIESVFARPVVILPDRENPHEVRYRAIGVTNGGRRAFIVFTLRAGRDGQRLRPISARYMHEREVRAYEEADSNVPDGSRG